MIPSYQVAVRKLLCFSFYMASTTHILSEIASAKSFFSVRGDDASSEKMRSTFAKGVIQQINTCLSLPMADATMLLEMLTDSPYGELTPDVKAAIDKKVGQASTCLVLPT